MSASFDPHNKVIQLCLRGMSSEDAGKTEEAKQSFVQACNEAENDFEKYIAAYYVARHQDSVADRLQWLETALGFAKREGTVATISAFPGLYSNIAECYQQLGDFESARQNLESADSFRSGPTDDGPFYHGTRADLKTGDLLMPGGNSNYKDGLTMNHIYFTALPNGAGLAAALSKGDGPERVYVVEPTGPFENDPNVTDKKFPGNPTRSYRSSAPLRIVGELADWVRQTPQQISEWREKLSGSKGEIIN